MVSLEHATLARLSRGGFSFEILVDPDLALRLKKGESVDVQDVLASQQVFSHAKKGDRVPEEELEKVFKTKDIFTIATAIIKHGELQLTTEQRRRFVEDKKKQIADIISKQGMDPKTRLPHPPSRILNAMEEAHVSVDPFLPASEQIKGALSKIQGIIPITLERVEIAIRVPMQHAGRASSVVRNISPIKSEEWKSDAWVATIEIPAGMQADIYEKLNKATGGQVEVKIVKEHKI